MGKPNKKRKMVNREQTTKLDEFMTDDILWEIFTRLPNFRSTSHCAAVCKPWRSVISQPEFVSEFKRQHLSESLPFTLLFREYNWDYTCHAPDTLRQYGLLTVFSSQSKILNGPERSARVSGDAYLDFLPAQSMVRSSCKDLLLIQFHQMKRLGICNPLTRQFVKLPFRPLFRLRKEPDPDSDSDSGFDSNDGPQPRSYNCGIVCDPSSELNYRVLVMRSYPVVMSVQMFRSETGRWHEHGWFIRITPGYFMLPISLGTSDGVIYTPMIKKELEGPVLKQIFAIKPFEPTDSTGLKYLVVDLPFGFETGREKSSPGRARIGVVRGGLRLWQSFWDQTTSEFVFKAWKLCDQEWEQVHDLRLSRVTNVGSKFMPRSIVMAVHPNDDNIFFFKDNDNPKMYKYYIRTKKCKKVGKSNSMSPEATVYPVVHQPYPTKIPVLK